MAQATSVLSSMARPPALMHRARFGCLLLAASAVLMVVSWQSTFVTPGVQAISEGQQQQLAGGSHPWRQACKEYSPRINSAMPRAAVATPKVVTWEPNCVRQWAPEEIPAGDRRKLEDRMRFELSSDSEVPLLECVEILQDLAQEIGADIDGPFISKKQSKKYVFQKGPHGHGYAKRHLSFDTHRWIMDFYPVDGEAQPLLKIHFPNSVQVKLVSGEGETAVNGGMHTPYPPMLRRKV
eukprot:801803-Amphidinium_carterae.2